MPRTIKDLNHFITVISNLKPEADHWRHLSDIKEHIDYSINNILCYESVFDELVEAIYNLSYKQIRRIVLTYNFKFGGLQRRLIKETIERYGEFVFTEKQIENITKINPNKPISKKYYFNWYWDEDEEWFDGPL
jgi:hypothetical protein